LILKDFRGNPGFIVFVRIRKQRICLLSLCSLREQTTKSSELAAGGAAENQGEKKKAALRPPRAMEIP